MVKKIFHNNAVFLIAFAVWMLTAICIAILYSDKEIFFAINRIHNFFFDHVMTVLSAYGRGDTVTIVFVSLLLIPFFRNKIYVLTTGLFGIITHILNYASKDFFERARPIGEYNVENVHCVPWLTNLVNNSFPSGHTMGAFGLFFLLNHFLPEKNKGISLFFFALALGCGYSRIYLGQHFFSDVLAGSIIGMTVSFVLILCVNLSFQKKELNA